MIRFLHYLFEITISVLLAALAVTAVGVLLSLAKPSWEPFLLWVKTPAIFVLSGVIQHRVASIQLPDKEAR